MAAGGLTGNGLEIRRSLDPFVSTVKCAQSKRRLRLMARNEGPPKLGSVPTMYVRRTGPREDRGLFDRNHVRFLTRKGLLDLLRDAGLAAERLVRRYRFRDRLASRFPVGTGPLLKLLFPNLFTLQYVAMFRRADAPGRALPAAGGGSADTEGACG